MFKLRLLAILAVRVDRAREIYHVDKDTRFLHDVRQRSQCTKSSNIANGRVYILSK